MTKISQSIAVVACGLLAALVVRMAPVSYAKPPPGPPDLTQGAEVDTSRSWNLGPTGARGWMWWGKGKRKTAESRQILITEVAKGSPADGVLEVGDVILGADGERFTTDARRSLGRAITEAERKESGGRLKLLIWRNGKTRDAVLTLRVMGTYSATAPYDCPKSRAILERGCRRIAEEKDWGRFSVGALALLACGKEEYRPLVREHIRGQDWASPDLELTVESGGKAAWIWGYRALVLAEYYLATEDDSVLPAIREHATHIARGQSGVGTWGHGMAWTALNDGTLHGRLGGYGALNQAGLVCHLAMVLARRCGVETVEIDRAIGRANRFFAYYTGKGSIPYGDHRPWMEHANNGKNSIAAIVFGLQDRRRAARFFAKMTTASYEAREWGHTGNYFSYLWGGPGAAQGGPKAVAAFLREQRWYYDLARRFDGTFAYQPIGGGKGKRYHGFSTTAAYMLTYALPLRTLTITGRDADQANWLSAEDVQEAVAAGRHSAAAYKQKSADELLERLASWSPVVRLNAAKALAKTEAEVVPRLTRMLEGESRHAQLGACRALERLGSRAAPAVPALAARLSSDDLWLRERAAHALKGIGEAARPAVPDMLKAAARDDPRDHRDHTQRALAFALFYSGGALGKKGLLADSLEGVDRELLYPAVRAVLENEDGRARSCLRSVYRNLTLEDVRALGPDILRGIDQPAPSGIMFASGVRIEGLRLLARHHFREGMAACIRLLRTQNPWGSMRRTPQVLDILKSYGAAAQEVLPDLEALILFFRDQKLSRKKQARQKMDMVRDTIEAIRAAEERPTLRSLRSGDSPRS